MCIQEYKGVYKLVSKGTGELDQWIKAFAVKATGPEFKSPASKLKLMPVIPDLGDEARRSPGLAGQPV